jgi:hypothetical protein
MKRYYGHHPMSLGRLTMTINSNTQLKVCFIRKPADLKDVMSNNDPDKTPSNVSIELHQTLSTAEYDRFAANFYQDYDWLKGRGGYINNELRSAVEVSAPDRITLYVDPSGSAYGRYVGIAV